MSEWWVYVKETGSSALLVNQGWTAPLAGVTQYCSAQILLVGQRGYEYTGGS
jgi:hypothetical protein